MASREAPNLENLLQMAITAIKEGNKEGARVMLQQVLDGDKRNDRAWVLMASVAQSSAQRRQYLETALKYNPNNKQAQQALSKISKRSMSREQRTLVIGGLVVLSILVFALLVFLIIMLAS